MRKLLVAAPLFLTLFVYTIASALACPVYIAADNFTRPSPAINGWGTSQNTHSATDYAWAGDLATDSGAGVLGGYGLVMCSPCSVGRAFSGTLGPSETGGTVSATFENMYAAQQVSVAENATSDLCTAYLARVNYANNTLEIVKRVAGVDTVLSSTPLPPFKKTWLTVTLTVNGDSLTATAQYNCGPTVTTSATDASDQIASGYAGIYVKIASAKCFDEVLFKNFVATEPAA